MALVGVSLLAAACTGGAVEPSTTVAIPAGDFILSGVQIEVHETPN